MSNLPIERIRLGTEEYDIFVPKDWDENDPNKIAYIENRTHKITTESIARFLCDSNPESYYAYELNNNQNKFVVTPENQASKTFGFFWQDSKGNHHKELLLFGSNYIYFAETNSNTKYFSYSVDTLYKVTLSLEAVQTGQIIQLSVDEASGFSNLNCQLVEYTFTALHPKFIPTGSLAVTGNQVNAANGDYFVTAKTVAEVINARLQGLTSIMDFRGIVGKLPTANLGSDYQIGDVVIVKNDDDPADPNNGKEFILAETAPNTLGWVEFGFGSQLVELLGWPSGSLLLPDGHTPAETSTVYQFIQKSDEHLNKRIDDLKLDVENIFLTEDLKFTEPFGKFGTEKDSSTKASLEANGYYTIDSAEGTKSLADLLNSAFAVKSDPVITTPSITCTFNNTGEFEVGSKIQPQVKFVSGHLGKYSYGPVDTGATWKSFSYWINSSEKTTIDLETSEYNNEYCNIGSEITVQDNTNITVHANASYSAATKNPKDSLGTECPSLKFAAGNTPDQSATITGYRCMFFRTYESITELNTSNLRPSSVANNPAAPKAAKGTYSLPIPAGTKQVCIALPNSANLTLGAIIPSAGLQVDISSSFESTSDISIIGAASSTGTPYTVYTLTALDGLSANTYSITIKEA